MRDLILIKENEEMQGNFDTKTLRYKEMVPFSVPAFTTMRLQLDFPFVPVNQTTEVGFNWSLDSSQAVKGLVLGGAEVTEDSVTFMITNASDEEQLIAQDELVVSVEFFKKSMVKAINTEKLGGVVDLNKKSVSS